MGSFLMGRKGTDARVQDTTATEFQGLRNPLADALRAQLGSRGYQGPYAAQMGAGEMQGIQGVQNAAGGVGGPNMGMAALASQAQGQMNPFAGLSGMERYGLNQVSQQAYGTNPMLQMQQQQAFMPNGLQNTVNSQLQQLSQGGTNPMLDSLIQSATRPILQNFDDQAMAQRGLYTSAGQQVQGQGSSPFAMASARLAGNTQNAIGDVTTNLTAQINQQDQQRQLAALGMGQQQQGLNYQGAQLADSMSNNAMQRALSGFEAAGTGATRQGAAYENAANRQVQAGSELGQQTTANQMAQLQAQLQNLQAQGLPRSVEQLGIEGGLAQYNNQQNQMLQLMQLMGGMTQNGSQLIPGRAAETGLIQSGLNSFLGGMGGAMKMSDRRAKKDVQRAGTLPSGLPLYRFRYLWEDHTAPMQLGVMADEAERFIPDAVKRAPTGLAFVDYDKVLAHGC